jgi:hypothetical protein
VSLDDVVDALAAELSSLAGVIRGERDREIEESGEDFARVGSPCPESVGSGPCLQRVRYRSEDGNSGLWACSWPLAAGLALAHDWSSPFGAGLNAGESDTGIAHSFDDPRSSLQNKGV